jgi:cytochrome c-type biogenesis protein CcmH/NrfG
MNAYGMQAGTPNREELLKMAITSARNGNEQAAKMMFNQVLSQDPNNERALMWMADMAKSKQERAQWLNRVLAVNPMNEQAQEALRRMAYRSSARDNRVLVIYGVIAAVLVIVLVVVIILLATT